MGAATTRPMQAFTSATARAAAIIRVKPGATRVEPWSSHWRMRAAPPRMSPLREFWGVARPRSWDWRITWMRRSISARTSASGRPAADASWRMKISARDTPPVMAAAT